MDYQFDLDIQILMQVKQWVNPSRPLHMFGLGLPSFLHWQLHVERTPLIRQLIICMLKMDGILHYSPQKTLWI